MSVRTEKAGGAPPMPIPGASEISAAVDGAQPEAGHLAEGNSFNVAAPDNPLQRNVVVSIRASLNDLCLQKQKGTWSPSGEALKQIFQQRKL